MDDATDSTPIDTDPTSDSDAPPELIQLYQVCDANTWWIQNESMVNPSWIPGQCLSLHFFDVGLWEARLPVDVMLFRDAKHWGNRLVGKDLWASPTRWSKNRWVGWTKLNWWMDWWIDVDIDGCFFSHQAKNSLHLWMQPQLKRHRRNPWFLEKQFPARFPAHMTWWFQWSELQAGRGGVFPVSPFGPSVGARAGVLGCGFSQRGPCSMCCWSTMGLGAELLGSSSCNAARCRSEKCTFFLGGLDLLCGHVNLYVDRHVLIQSNVTNVSRYAWTLNSFTVLDTFDGSLHALRRDRYG